MPRKLKNTKPLIYVFCEGESEQAYTDFLKKEFADVALIKRPGTTGIFEEAAAKFSKDAKYRDSAEVTDEIWFFFDVEQTDISKWDSRNKIMKSLRKLRKDPNIRIRLLMTTACIEYWFMLHYQYYVPNLATVADKAHVMANLLKKEPLYQKGDSISTERIASHYPTAVGNGEKTVRNQLAQGMPCMEDTDDRNKWLYTCCNTFSNVYEAIQFLEELKNKLPN